MWARVLALEDLFDVALAHRVGLREHPDLLAALHVRRAPARPAPAAAGEGASPRGAAACAGSPPAPPPGPGPDLRPPWCGDELAADDTADQVDNGPYRYHAILAEPADAPDRLRS